MCKNTCRTQEEIDQEKCRNNILYSVLLNFLCKIVMDAGEINTVGAKGGSKKKEPVFVV